MHICFGIAVKNMRLFVDNQGNIIETSAPIQEGLNIIGAVYGCVEDDFTILPFREDALLREDISPADIDAAGMMVFLKNRKALWIAPDVSAIRDVFYGKISDREWVLSDNFFEVLHAFKSVSASKDNLVFFLRHGYFPPEQTFFNKILRVPPGMKLVFCGESPQIESIWKNVSKKQERSYEVFKNAISSVVDNRLGDDDAILLSGGCDSGLLVALAAIKFGKTPLTCTALYKQTLYTNELDAIWAKKISAHYGLKHCVAVLDLNDEYEGFLKDIVSHMPLAAHFSVGFLRMFEEVSRHGKHRLWSGQNADSVYNFGPTSKSLGGILKRWYLSKEYWSTFPDIKERSSLSLLSRLGGELGLQMLRSKKGMQVRQPKTFAEFLYVFEHKEGSYRFPAPGDNPTEKFSDQPLSYQEAKELFFDRKLQTFLTGGDPRIHYGLADKMQKEVVLPYTAANMINFFRGMELTLMDSIYPKRYIYRYLKELLGVKAFKTLYGSRGNPPKNVHYLTWQEWQKEAAENTTFGKELFKNAERTFTEVPFLKELWNPYNQVHLLSMFWMGEIISRAKNQGIHVDVNE